MTEQKKDNQLLDEYIEQEFPDEIIMEDERKAISNSIGFAAYSLIVRWNEFVQAIKEELHI